MNTIVIDIETTGLPAKGATYQNDFMQFPHIVSLSYKINSDKTKTFIINQEGRSIPPEATAIHGITAEVANSSPDTLESVFNELIGLEIPDHVIGHNLYFDTSIMKANALRSKYSDYAKLEILFDKTRRIDTMQKTAKLMGGWKSLVELHTKLFDQGFDAHNSEDDVDACHRCFLKLREMNVL